MKYPLTFITLSLLPLTALGDVSPEPKAFQRENQSVDQLLLSQLQRFEQEFSQEKICAQLSDLKSHDKEAHYLFIQKMRFLAHSRNPMQHTDLNYLAAAFLFSHHSNELEYLWWKSSNRELRLAILMLYYGSRKDVDVSIIPRFEQYCGRFTPSEAQLRYEELIAVLQRKRQIEEKVLHQLYSCTHPQASSTP